MTQTIDAEIIINPKYTVGNENLDKRLNKVTIGKRYMLKDQHIVM